MEVAAPLDPARALEDGLLDLADELRRADFKIGVGEVLRAQELLVALAGRGRLPCPPRTLRNYLAPLFCSKPAEQEQFYARFGDWLNRHPEARELLVSGADDNGSVKGRGGGKNSTAEAMRRRQDLKIEQPPGLLRLAVLAAGVLFVVLATSVAAAFFIVPSSPTLSGVVVEAGGGPVTGAEVTFARQRTKTSPDGRFSLTYEAQPGGDDLVVSHEEFDPWRKSFATDDTAPQVTLEAIELTRRLRAPTKIEPAPPPTPEPTPRATPEPVQAPTLTDADRQRFRAAVERINAFAETSRVAEPLSGWRRLYFLYYNWARGLATGLPLLFAGLWGAWFWYQRRLVLKQRAAGHLPEVDRIVVSGARGEVFASERLRRTSQKYRTHSGVPSRELEGAATVHRTARRAGLFTPVYGARQVRPEYLALIDRADFADHQAAYFDALLARLAAEGVFVSRYFFDGDPRLCFGPQPGAPLSLAELAAKHADDRVMVFSEGAGFINDLSGRPKAFVEDFAPWRQKALLTPRAAPDWGPRERSLAEWGFNVLHASEEGLEAFIETVQTGEATATAARAEWTPPYPPLLAERPARWLGRRAPDEVEGEVLDAQLRYFLGEDGYYWLVACAVYPALRWDVTIFLGHRLKGTGGRRLLEQATLLKLSRLPWFRHGRMPDWLRARLLRRLDGERERPIREALEALLLSHLERPADGVPLDFARDDEERPSRRRRRKLLRGLYRSLTAQSPLCDYVFLTFMSERKPDPLELELPDAVSRALARHQPRPFGLSPRGVAAASVVLAIIGWLLLTSFRPQVNYLAVVPTFNPEETGAAADILPSAEPLSVYYNNLRRYRAEAFEKLLNSGYFGDGTATPANLDAETADAYALRPAVYRAWLEDTLRRDVPDLDLTAFRLTSLNINDVGAWGRERLYIEPVPTGVVSPVPAPPTPEPALTPGPSPAVTRSPATTPGRAPTQRATPGTSPSPGPPASPTPPPRELVEGSTVIAALAQASERVRVNFQQGVIAQVSPPDILDQSLAQLGVADNAAISFLKIALLKYEPQLRGAIEKISIEPGDTVREVIRKVGEARDVPPPATEGNRSPRQQSVNTQKVYILYDEANKAAAQAAEQALRSEGFRNVQSFVAYTLERPQGTATFRPQAGATAPTSIIYFNGEAANAARNIQSLLSKIVPGITAAPSPAGVRRDAYFDTFVRINKVDVQVSLLGPDAWRGTYGQSPRSPIELAAEALREVLELEAPSPLAAAGNKWADYPLSHYFGSEVAVDEAVSVVAPAFFKEMGWPLTPEIYSRLRTSINLSMTVRNAAETMVNARMSTRQQGPPATAN